MQIPMRYPVVELATALIFASVAAHFWLVDVRMVLPFWIFSSLLLVGAVVDVEFYLLPDQTTLGLAVIGVACSALVPAMHGVVGWKSGLGASLIGAATGFGMLWLVAELGKRFLGTVKYAFEEPVRFEWRRMGDLAEIRFDGETSSWNELFYRKGDRVRLGFTRMRLALSNGGVVEVTAGEVEAALERWIVGGSLYDLNAVDSIELEVTRLSLPREAMGFGDVKLMAGVGAFLGWKGAVVTVFGGACVGSLWAVLASLMGHRDWAARIPFGPFLSVVALAWVFFGAYLEPFLSRFRLVWEVVTEQAR
jgi:leader peptidase (prepilin peptidase)/N-methyltransferase